MQYTINQLYDYFIQPINAVYEIFKNHFKEDYVDLQPSFNQSSLNNEIIYNLSRLDIKSNEDGLYDVSNDALLDIKNRISCQTADIYIWFPNVIVTNENNRSVNIQDLYAKVTININGQIPYEYVGFTLNRATYSSEQFNSDYLHSHIRCIPKDDFSRFMEPCLGRGPIKNTIVSLKTSNDEYLWMLFCQELSMCVTIESLQGGPWKCMEYIGTSSTAYYNYYNLKDAISTIFKRTLSEEMLYSFIEYYLKNGNLNFYYSDNKYNPGLSYFDYMIDVSNSFIEYINSNKYIHSNTIQAIFDSNILQKLLIKDRKFYKKIKGIKNEDYSPYIGAHILYFKGNDVTLNINISNSNEAFPVTILNHQVAMYIIKSILTILNFRYNNEYSNNTTNSTETPSSTYKKVFYI